MIIEEPVRFSESKIWQGVKDFYTSAGIEAWDTTAGTSVPFYETSNPYIAESYANLIIRFIQDCVHAGRYKQEEPFYILELGAGSGTFAFYLVKHLSRLKKLLGFAQARMVYVITDLAQKDVDFCKHHPALQPYVQEGLVDFAVFDVQRDREIVLQCEARTISASAHCRTANPLIAIANYLFDALPQDVFRITNGEIQPGLVTVTAEREKRGKHASAQVSIRTRFSYERSAGPFYTNHRLEATLEKCRSQLSDHYLLFPVGALRCIDNLVEIAANQLCLLASDLGFSSTFETSQRAEQGVNINANGFGAMVVNFEAIGRYFEHIGGDVLHQAGQPFLETSVFLAGFHFNDLPETQYAMDLLVNGRGHDFLYSLYDEVETMPFYMLLPFLQATRWDPMIFHHYIDSIVEHARENSVQLTEMLPTLLPAMAEIADNFYYVPGLPDIYYDICVFSQEVGEYRQTLEYYQKSLALFGPSDVKLYNMGVCHYLLGERDLALDNLQAALARNPEYTKAKELIAHIEQERQAASP